MGWDILLQTGGDRILTVCPVPSRSSGFVPGSPGTEEFVQGILLLLLSRDKGTAGQGIFYSPGRKGRRDKEIFSPGQRDNGTCCSVH